MKTNEPFSNPDGAVILLKKTGITSDLFEEINSSILPIFAKEFHNQLIERKILSSSDGKWEWFKDGLPAQMIAPGEDWKKGKLRLRVIAEFVLDDIESEKISSQDVSTSSVSPSLDDNRNTIEPN